MGNAQPNDLSPQPLTTPQPLFLDRNRAQLKGFAPMPFNPPLRSSGSLGFEALSLIFILFYGGHWNGAPGFIA